MAEINESQVGRALESAALQTTQVKEEFTTILLNKIPKSLITKIKNKGHTFASYARMAVEEKARRDGLL